jgi:hypothetical protein
VNLRTKARRRIEQAARTFVKTFRRQLRRGSRSEEPLVFAVTHCYPMRVVLYAAAFQGGWNLQFLKSLGEALHAVSARRPRAVFYDHAAGDPAWRQYCSSLFREGIPFIALAHNSDDETFLSVLAAGGYPAFGEPLTSEGILNAVDFAEELAGRARLPEVACQPKH